MKLLDAITRRAEKMTPETFLSLSPERRADIKTVRIVSPRLGSDGFGYLEVTYKTPRYTVIADAARG